MKLEGEQFIKASREQVFAALNDPEILKQCIPGCEELNKGSDTEMNAKVSLKVGPVRAKFTGAVTLSNLNPPESYTITGEGKGGAAGFAKGGADVSLQAQDGGTLLVYNVKADLGGKIAQLGARLMDSTAKKLASQFFETFGSILETDENENENHDTDARDPSPAVNTATDEEGESKKTNMLNYLIGGALVVAVIWYLI